MRLLVKWLRPDVIPSPRRKKIPFGIKLQLFLYRRCLKKLAKWYSRYAFSDNIVISGTPTIKLMHDFRDYSFEAELKRIHLFLPDGIHECSGTTSSFPDKRKRRPYYSRFLFEDHFLLEVDGKKVSIDHGQGRSFVSTIKGRLKESETTSTIAKYVFSGSYRSNKTGESTKSSSISNSISSSILTSQADREGSISVIPAENKGASLRKTGGLFGNDPLLGIKPESQEELPSVQSPSIKSLEGVTIDESF